MSLSSATMFPARRTLLALVQASRNDCKGRRRHAWRDWSSKSKLRRTLAIQATLSRNVRCRSSKRRCFYIINFGYSNNKVSVYILIYCNLLQRKWSLGSGWTEPPGPTAAPRRRWWSAWPGRPSKGSPESASCFERCLCVVRSIAHERIHRMASRPFAYITNGQCFWRIASDDNGWLDVVWLSFSQTRFWLIHY